MAAFEEAKERAETFRPEVKAKVSFDNQGLATVSFSPEVSLPKYMLKQGRSSQTATVDEELIEMS